MNFRTLVVRGLKWQAVLIVGQQLLSLVVFTVLARLLQPSDFGLMGLTYIYFTLAGFIADQAIGAAIVQTAKLEREHLDTGFWYAIAWAVLLCGTTLLLANPLAALLGDPRLAPILRWSSLSLVFASGSWIQNALFTRDMDFRRPAIRSLAGQLSGGIVGVSMALSGWGVWALVGQHITSTAVATILVAMLSSYRPRLSFSLPHLRELLRTGIPIFLNWVVGHFSSRMDQLVIGRAAGTQMLGIYVLASKIPDLARHTLFQAISNVSVPAFSRLQHDPARLRETMYQGMRLNTVVMFAIFPGAAMIAPDLVVGLFGSSWATAGPLCSLLCCYPLLQSLFVFTYAAMLASKLQRSHLGLSIASAAGNWLACIIGVQYGLHYVVISLMIKSVILSPISLVLLKRRIGLSLVSYFRPCLVPAGAALFMIVTLQCITLLLPNNPPLWLKLPCFVVSGAICYLGFLRIVSPERMELFRQFVTQAIRGSAGAR